MRVKQVTCFCFVFKQFSTCLEYDAIIHYFQIVLNIFKISCNQYKLLHHYFQTVLNMFQIWCNNIWTCSKGDAMKLNYCITFLAYVPWLSWPGLACSNDIMTKSSKIIASCFSKQVWACLRYDAIQQNYCIIIFKQFSTCLEYDAIKTKYCITISNSFEHV